MKRLISAFAIFIVAAVLLSGCSEESRPSPVRPAGEALPAGEEDAPPAEGDAQGAEAETTPATDVEATPVTAGTPTPVPTPTPRPTPTPTPSPTPTAVATITQPSPTTTPEPPAETGLEPTPAPGDGTVPTPPSQPEIASGGALAGESATSTETDLAARGEDGPSSEAATSTVAVAEAAPAPEPVSEIRLTGVRTQANRPGQIQFVFSLRDQDGRAVDVPADVIRGATRIFEQVIAVAGAEETAAAEGPPAAEDGLDGAEDLLVETGDRLSIGDEQATAVTEASDAAQKWEEIDYTETTIIVRTADVFLQEVVFVLDFTSSMAGARLSDGSSGTQAMIEALFRAIDRLPENHRIGVVEFHDRNVEPGVLSRLTTDRKAIRTMVSAFATSPFDPGSSRVWDSIGTAATLFTGPAENPSVVKSIVFITDGRDTSSNLTRNEVGAGASSDGLQLYGVGVGDVFGEAELKAMVRSTGGVYYAVRTQEKLQSQLEFLAGDLLKQYQVSYTSLRGGTYLVRLEIELAQVVWTFESEPLDSAEFAGPDIEGRIAIDTPQVDLEEGVAKVSLRALHVPRNIARFRFRLDAPDAVEISLVPKAEGGLVEEWELSGPDAQGFFDLSAKRRLEFGEFGLLFRITLSGITEDTVEVPLEFDNSIYTGGKSFNHPPAIVLGEPKEVEVAEESAPPPPPVIIPESIYRRWGRQD